MGKFVPLHIISGYSFLSSGLTMDKIISSIVQQGYEGAGLTDFSVLLGAPEFMSKMAKINKKAIIGMDIQYKKQLLTLFCINEEGYLNLCKISSLIQKNNFDQDYLLKHHSGLIGVLNTNNDSFKDLFESDELNRTVNDISKAVDTFYIGLEATSKEEMLVNKSYRIFAREHTYECVAFPSIKYQKKDDAIVIDIVRAISSRTTLEEKSKIGQQYFMEEANYHKIYLPSEIDNTEKILNASTLNFKIKRGKIIHYPVENSENYLKSLVNTALINKNLNIEQYIHRANYELETIIEMGYTDYFLIVQDYVNYARSVDILVAPGRGSAAGSLVAYLLGITEIDPIKYDLSFERFLNKARKSMPDIDIDFMDTRRNEMYKYMRDKYGEDHVANIITYQTMQAKASLQEIKRVYQYSEISINQLSKALGNKGLTLRDSYKKIPEFKELIDRDKHYLDIVTLASKIEGLPKTNGVHAAGIILNDKPIEEAMPIYLDKDGTTLSQFEKDYVEDQGFLKMDFLSNRNLTIIDYAVKLANLHHPDINLKGDQLPFDDPAALKLIADGQTKGLFQLGESLGMSKTAVKIKPTTYPDIALIIAIFRPGPMDNIDEYVRRRRGKTKVTYLSKDIENVLKDTYGILIYQEQISQIAQVMAGLSPSEADVFRSAVSKKKKEVLDSQRKAFIEGSIKNGYKEKDVLNMFETIEKFANYGFNKAHAYSYAILTSRMAYLKAHYPLEFYTSLVEISSGANDVKFAEYMQEMKKRNIHVLVPDINKSTLHFEAVNNDLLYPLSWVKGINSLQAQNIFLERNENGEFTDFFDFCRRMHAYHLGIEEVRALVNAGAFDNFGFNRETLFATALPAMQYAQLNYLENGQMMLSPILMSKPRMIMMEDDLEERLIREYSALGFMLSTNPLSLKKEEIDKIPHDNIADINNEFNEMIEATNDKASKYYNQKQLYLNATIVGYITDINSFKTKKSNKEMAYINLFDETDSIKLTLFNDAYVKYHNILKPGIIVTIKGKMQWRNSETSFIIDTINLLETSYE